MGRSDPIVILKISTRQNSMSAIGILFVKNLIAKIVITIKIFLVE